MTTSSVPEFEPITSQEDFDKRLASRLERERAKFADYDDLKSKATKFSEYEDAQKSVAEKQAERLAAVEAELNAERTTRSRLEIASKHNIPADYMDLLTGSDPDSLESQAVRIAALVPQKPVGPLVPKQGNTPTAPLNATESEFVSNLFGESQ